MRNLGLMPEAIDEITPLQAMLAVLVTRLKAGDHDGALVAAEAAAPYCHARLASADVRFSKNSDLDSMTDEELEAEAAELERRIAEAKKLPH